MKRVKKPKKANNDVDVKDVAYKVLMDTNYLNLALFLIVLKTQFGFGKKRLMDTLEGYLALMQEIADKRQSVDGAIIHCRKAVGVDPKEFLTYVENNRYDAWRKGIENARA